MDTTTKNLLVRADFVLGREHPGERHTYRRWRRVFLDGLPHLLGCAHRCGRAERVRLHKGDGAGSFTAWLRIPIERRPSRRRLRRFKGRLCARLEAVLAPLGGQVLKLGVRRLRPRPGTSVVTELAASQAAA